ncbi:ABC transporter permease [Chitinophaga sp. W2I13]|uniref:ABC transporter permease n=1 Tax=Chitinophaga sp. W2I13 TaxID=3373923 RepID=UPI003D1DB9DF
MINSYFKLSFRTLWRKKSFSLLNITGLAVGIGASLLIFLVIRNEMSYDTYQSKRERIFRVVTTFTNRSTGEKWRHSMVPAPLASAMRRDFPSLEKVAVAEYIGGAQVYVPGENGGEEKKFKESGGPLFCGTCYFRHLRFCLALWKCSGIKGTQYRGAYAKYGRSLFWQL